MTLWYCVKTAERIVDIPSLPSSPVIVVICRCDLITLRKSEGRPMEVAHFWPISRYIYRKDEIRLLLLFLTSLHR